MNLKITTKPCLKQVLQKLKNSGKKIVFTNGCFDLMHAGHIDYLQKARRLGDVLIVGLNTDASVRKLKGEGRPIINQKDRAKILSALECVNHVVFFDELTPANIIKFVRPDVLVKGADYKINEIVGNDTVNNYGGKVVTIPLVKGKSTSSIIKKIKKLY